MTLFRASLLALPAILALQSHRVTFDAPRDYYVESYALATGDVNEDGSMDIVAATYNISLLLGAPDGVLQRPTLIAGGNAPVTQVVLADFNSDGHLDLAAAVYADPGRVAVRLGVGNGTFTAPTDYALASPPAGLVAGDFNGDDILDLATTNPHVGGGSLLTGNGSGTFATAVSFPLTGLPTKVRSADFDGDSADDLLVYDIATSDVVHVFLSDGAGGFRIASTVNVNVTGSSDTVPGPPADYDGDGTVDLIVYGAAGVHLFVGAGDGTFGPRTEVFSPQADAVAVADFDGDLKADIAVLRGFGANITMLSGNDDGTFAVTASNSLGHVEATTLVAANLNQDTRMDLVIANVNFAMLQVRMGNGDGTFGTARIIADGNVLSLIVADFNGDGAMDTASVVGDPLRLSVSLGNGDGTFQSPIETPLNSVTEAGISADVNDDAIPDLILFAHEIFSRANDVWVYIGNGDGTFQPGVAYTTGDIPVAVTVADFTSDAILDIVVALRKRDRPTSLIVMLAGVGSGGFAPAVEIARAVYAASIVTADFNGDLTPDLAVTQGTNVAGYPTAIGIYLNSGTGSFTASYIPVPEPWRLGHLTAADSNGDGHADLLAIGGQQAEIRRNLLVSLLGRGDGTFTSAGISVVGGSAIAPLAVDLDADGMLDVAVGALSAMHVLIGNGDGTFTPVGNFSVDGDRVRAGAAADFNGDAKPDLAVLSEVRRYRDDGAVFSVPVARLLTNATPAPSP